MLVETRGNDGVAPKSVNFQDAILNPRASFGGLYTFKEIPRICVENLIDLSYNELIRHIFAALKVDLELDSALDSYKSFDCNTPLTYTSLGNVTLQNLYTGPTRAFKDMAMQPFGSILCSLAQKERKKYLILSATSGDTGPATLSAIKDKENIYGICMYPHNGTSRVQRLQMSVIDSPNIKVLAINGDFDDAQNSLKALLSDKDFHAFLQKHNFALSATNSINIGRIIFQIIYHVHSYLFLRKNGAIRANEAINIIIPSGNFGNALGAYFARKMGVNINKIIIATNANNVLCDFIENGVYDISNRALIATNSPAMDILKSSNIERVLFDLFEGKRTKELMESLEKNKCYVLDSNESAQVKEIFDCFSSDDKECENIIKKYAAHSLIIDPHTANALSAYEALKNKYTQKSIVCSTAEWTKFAPTIANAINGSNLTRDDDKIALDSLQKQFSLNIHENIRALFDKKEIHTENIDKEKIKSRIQEWLEKL